MDDEYVEITHLLTAQLGQIHDVYYKLWSTAYINLALTSIYYPKKFLSRHWYTLLLNFQA